MILGSLLLMDLALVVLLDVAIVRPIARTFRRRRGGHQLGRLSVAGTPTAEALRAARLRQLGEEGTYRVYNCGVILEVDYERGQLVVERPAR